MDGDPFFAELLAPHDMRWSINVGFQVRSEWWAVSVNRTPKQGPFLPAEWPEMTGLAQHLAGACSMALALRCEHARGFADALHAMKLGAIAIGHDGNVLFVNPTAERLLGDVLDLRGGRLRAITGQNTEVEDLVASMLRPARLSSPPRSLILKGKGRRSRVALYACRLSAERDIDPVAGSVAGLVVVNDLWERRPVRRDVLKALYRLTNAEVRLVEELVQGRSLKEASERLKIAQETARSYLKGVFFKTGAHRQGELIALVDHISSVPGDPGGRSRGP
jgi:DNA-binding CsgD family transcriptional regulator